MVDIVILLITCEFSVLLMLHSQNGADINATTASGLTPLMIACQRGNISVVNTLLARGADVNIVRPCTTPLQNTRTESALDMFLNGSDLCSKLQYTRYLCCYLLNITLDEDCIYAIMRFTQLGLQTQHLRVALRFIAPRLKEFPSTVSLLSRPDLSKANPYHAAALSVKSTKFFDILQRNGVAGVSSLDEDGLTPLSLACSPGGNKDVAMKLLEYEEGKCDV